MPKYGLTWSSNFCGLAVARSTTTERLCLPTRCPSAMVPLSTDYPLVPSSAYMEWLRGRFCTAACRRTGITSYAPGSLYPHVSLSLCFERTRADCKRLCRFSDLGRYTATYSCCFRSCSSDCIGNLFCCGCGFSVHGLAASPGSSGTTCHIFADWRRDLPKRPWFRATLPSRHFCG